VLQRAIIAGERADLLPLAMHQSLAAFVLPLLQHLCRNVGPCACFARALFSVPARLCASRAVQE
jgi:hypothetical protein